MRRFQYRLLLPNSILLQDFGTRTSFRHGSGFQTVEYAKTLSSRFKIVLFYLNRHSNTISSLGHFGNLPIQAPKFSGLGSKFCWSVGLSELSPEELFCRICRGYEPWNLGNCLLGVFNNYWQGFVTCNTSIDQYMYFKVPRETVNPLNSRLLGEAVRTRLDPILQSDSAITIDLAYILWMQSLSRLIDLVIPSEGQSLIYQPPIASNISSFSMRFDGPTLPKLLSDWYQGFFPGHEFNTPAEDYWILHVVYQFQNETISHRIDITFVPDGTIDFTRTKTTDIEIVNTLMQPMIMNLEIAAMRRGIVVDFWKILNWMFISSYWSLLADLGQTTSTTYPSSAGTFQGYCHVDLSAPIHHSETNNIWVNDTLYTIYSEYLLGTIVPLLGSPVPIAHFTPLNETNRIHPTTTTFLRTYTCNIRELKAPLPAIVSLVVSEYAFIKGGYGLFIFLAAWYEKKKYRGRMLPPTRSSESRECLWGLRWGQSLSTRMLRALPALSFEVQIWVKFLIYLLWSHPSLNRGSDVGPKQMNHQIQVLQRTRLAWIWDDQITTCHILKWSTASPNDRDKPKQLKISSGMFYENTAADDHVTDECLQFLLWQNAITCNFNSCSRRTSVTCHSMKDCVCMVGLQLIPHCIIIDLNHGPFPPSHSDLNTGNILYNEQSTIGSVWCWRGMERAPGGILCLRSSIYSIMTIGTRYFSNRDSCDWEEENVMNVSEFIHWQPRDVY